MRHAVMYETSPETIETSAKTSVCPRQAWQSCGKRLVLERELVFLFFLFSYLSRVPSSSLWSIYWCTSCVTFGLAYSFSTNIYTRKLGSCSCKLNIVTQVHHQAFCFIKQPLMLMGIFNHWMPNAMLHLGVIFLHAKVICFSITN